MDEPNSNLEILMLDDVDKLEKKTADALGIKKEWQSRYKLGFLIPVSEEGHWDLSLLEDLEKIRKSSLGDYKKLLATLKRQLQQRELMLCSNHLSQGFSQKKILEFKAANGGHSRLFAFIHDGNIFICTHVWWKTKDSKKQQDREFQKAEKMRQLFYQQLP